MKKALVLGCGYVGTRLARLLAGAGWEVTGVTRSGDSAARLAGEPFAVAACDIANAEDLVAGRLPRGVDVAISAVSPGIGGEAAYREVYLEGIRNVIAHLDARRVIFVSSSSVYEENDGSWVTEKTPAHPHAPTAAILREAEEAALATGGIAARLAGIYGPGRSIYLRRMLDGTAVIDGGGSRRLNMIHAYDASTALSHMILREVPAGVYNVADDESLTLRECYESLAAHLRMTPPPEGPADASRRRGLTDKRVSNAKLKLTGWAPVYRSYREAIPALASAARAGGSGDARP